MNKPRMKILLERILREVQDCRKILRGETS